VTSSLVLTLALASSLFEAPATVTTQLAKRFPGDARILSLDLRPDGFDVEVQDPAVPAHVDRFTFEDGALGGPEPVPVGRNPKQVEARLFSLADVDLTILPLLLADAVEQARAEAGAVAHVRIERLEQRAIDVAYDGADAGADAGEVLNRRHRDRVHARRLPGRSRFPCSRRRD
jgi:hypothetical protein